MVGRSKKPATAREKAHMARVKMIRCIACWETGLCCGPTEVHHTLSGGRRRGHLYVLPIGQWHHVGKPLPGMTANQMRLTYGPSLELHGKAFTAQYGSDDSLLAKLNTLLDSGRAD